MNGCPRTGVGGQGEARRGDAGQPQGPHSVHCDCGDGFVVSTVSKLIKLYTLSTCSYDVPYLNKAVEKRIIKILRGC